MSAKEDIRIGVIGLGYVGLPLAVAFGQKYNTIGFDLNETRIKELHSHIDTTKEVENEELRATTRLQYSSDIASLKDCNYYIVAVPTPIDKSKRPDLKPLISASKTVGTYLGKGDIVIYESTVYPGATEEVCVPVLEDVSGLRFNNDFFCGYSPERINPGDKKHRITDIIKVTSGSTPETAIKVDELYKSVIAAGTHLASSIKVAEAAKVIENTQRDVNIARVNDVALIFNRLGINTSEVLEAAGTKWNFLRFTPGLVGGHCIGVDPYYLTHKAQEVGYHPNMILAGRRLNDDMGRYVASRVIKLMLKKNIEVAESRILIMGLTFKENCPDLRNTKVVDIISELEDYGVSVDVYDPWVDTEEAEEVYQISLVPRLPQAHYDGIILAVAHDEFCNMSIEDMKRAAKPASILFDVKNILPHNMVDGSL